MFFLYLLFFMCILSVQIDRSNANDRSIEQELAVRLAANQVGAAVDVFKGLGCHLLGPIGSLRGYYLLDVSSLLNTVGGDKKMVERLLQDDARIEIEWFEWQQPVHVHRKDLWDSPTDPAYVLDQIDSYGNFWIHGASGATRTINVLPVWRTGLFGDGVAVVVVDDGAERDHPDLQANMAKDASLSWSTIKNSADPTPSNSDSTHGTATAGVCCGVNNQALNQQPSVPAQCGVGVAPKVSLGAVEVASRTSDANIATALSRGRDKVDIYSIGFGPSDDGKTLEPLTSLIATALSEGAQSGRSGRGNLFVVPSGNGGREDDSCAYDGYVNSRFTVAVGSVSPAGQSVPYGELCSGLAVVTPSSDGSSSGVGVRAPDLLGTRGKVAGDCSAEFGGTSASAAMTSGALAVLLEAVPTLTWVDVQGVLAYSATRVNWGDSSWTINSAGVSHSNRWGFGLLNVDRAVAVARTWTSYGSAAPTRTASGSLTANQGLAFNQPRERSWQCSATGRAVHVVVHLSVSHQSRGQLRVQLRSPSGTTVPVANPRPLDTGDNLNQWKFLVMALWDESIQGQWSLVVTDTVAGTDNGQWTSWSLEIFSTASGTVNPPNLPTGPPSVAPTVLTESPTRPPFFRLTDAPSIAPTPEPTAIPFDPDLVVEGCTATEETQCSERCLELNQILDLCQCDQTTGVQYYCKSETVQFWQQSWFVPVAAGSGGGILAIVLVIVLFCVVRRKNGNGGTSSGGGGDGKLYSNRSMPDFSGSTTRPGSEATSGASQRAGGGGAVALVKRQSFTARQGAGRSSVRRSRDHPHPNAHHGQQPQQKFSQLPRVRGEPSAAMHYQPAPARAYKPLDVNVAVPPSPVANRLLPEVKRTSSRSGLDLVPDDRPLPKFTPPQNY